ncbi:hypothetical protein GCM10009797_12830 [Nocardioides hwasunensis]
MAVFAQLSNARTSPSLTDFLGALFYVGNYTTGMQGSDNVLVHTWSLAVEEQFYIVWPILVMGIGAVAHSMRVLFSVAALGSVAAITLRLFLWDGGRGPTGSTSARTPAWMVCSSDAWSRSG